MGVLTDLIIADESQAEAVCKTIVPSETWPGIDAKGIDQVILGMLLSIITNQPYQNSMVDEFDLLYEGSDDGPWVYRIPDRLVVPLAELAGEAFEGTAQKWSQIDEFAPDRWQLQDVSTVLREICDLARQAREQKKALLMWICV